MLNKIRWKAFKIISAIGWWVCPEPHKSRLQASMPTWHELGE